MQIHQEAWGLPEGSPVTRQSLATVLGPSEGMVMGHVNHIGRVGALAVTLGVGWAVASAPGVAYADTSGASDAGQSSSGSASTPSRTEARTSGGNDTSGADGAQGRDNADNDNADKDDADKDDAVDDGKNDIDGDDDVKNEIDGNNDDGGHGAVTADNSANTSSAAEAEQSADLTGFDDAGHLDGSDASQELLSIDAGSSVTTTTLGATPAVKAPTKAKAPAEVPEAASTTVTAKPTLVSVISDVVSALLTPRTAPAPVSPLQGATMLASLAAARDELERNASRRSAVASGQAVAALGADTPNVLVIGVDGTNLARVLATLGNDSHFFKLIQDSTTAASSIVGHTTISNPSWSSILTGAWGEKTGVINNVFTPWTYNKWPTVFTQLETINPLINTTSIANWNVISGIADSGIGADTVLNVSQQPDDPDWLKTDDKVGALTAAAITAARADVANFMFSYFVGVDENGHMYGGDSPEYAEAIRNFDRNLGLIMEKVTDWENLYGEQWTIMMVTDHGHQPQKGLGHGFQSPDETSTFVIANNPLLFDRGAVNLKYSIVDVTPTVMTLFGFDPAGDADGVSLTDLDDSTVTPGDTPTALRQALNDAIAMYGYPDIGTNIALTVRTIATTIPYYVDNITNGIVSALQGLAAQEIFLISPLARLAIIPVDIIGDLAYIGTNIVAQIVARLTGVTGASIFPLQRPATPTFPEAPDVTTPDLVALTCTDGRVTGAVFACGASSMAA